MYSATKFPLRSRTFIHSFRPSCWEWVEWTSSRLITFTSRILISTDRRSSFTDRSKSGTQEAIFGFAIYGQKESMYTYSGGLLKIRAVRESYDHFVSATDGGDWRPTRATDRRRSDKKWIRGRYLTGQKSDNENHIHISSYKSIISVAGFKSFGTTWKWPIWEKLVLISLTIVRRNYLSHWRTGRLTDRPRMGVYKSRDPIPNGIEQLQGKCKGMEQ